MFSIYDADSKSNIQLGNNKLCFEIPPYFLQSGNYALSLFIVEDKRTAIFVEKDVFRFTVVDGGRDLGVYMGREPGYIRPQFRWSKL
jgi:lipopolysaccharide transport system ATP-binding protein